MAEAANPKPGPNTRDSREAVRQVLDQSDYPMAVGDIEEEVEFTRRTVHSRVKELQKNGEIESEKIGGSKAYFIAGRKLQAPAAHVSDGGMSAGIVEVFMAKGEKAALVLAVVTLTVSILTFNASGVMFYAGLAVVIFLAAITFRTLWAYAVARPDPSAEDKDIKNQISEWADRL